MDVVFRAIRAEPRSQCRHANATGYAPQLFDLLVPNCFSEPMPISRREVLRQFLFGPGMVGLRSALTGLPAALILAAESQSPRALARAATTAATRTPQFLLFSTSHLGDPINCNAPGTYADPSITHASDPAMAATSISFGSSQSTAAQVWTGLPASMLAQTSFFHHGTRTIQHSDIGNVLKGQGTILNKEMLPSLVAQSMSSKLATVREQPIVFNGLDNGAITSNGVLQPALTPQSLASMLSLPGQGLGDLNVVAMRDATVDSVHAWMKKNAAPYQASLIDSMSLSRQQARIIQQGVVSQLSQISGNDSLSQIRAGLLLFKLKITPVVLMSIDFGGDNHFDSGLVQEVNAHKNGVTILAQLPSMVDALGLTGQVSFGMLNVFGRTLSSANAHGRDHNGQHAVSLLYGANVKGGVVGGVSAGSDATPYTAQSILSSTGAASNSGDVSFADTLSSCAKTMCAAVGMDDSSTNTAITDGKIVTGALTA